MKGPVERDPPGLAADPDEDTAELQLSPRELDALSRAAVEARSAPLPMDPVDVPPCASQSHLEPSGRPARHALSLRWPRVPFEVATLVAVMAIALASGVHRSANAPLGKRVDHRVRIAVSTQTNSDMGAQPAGEPVKIQNPFDATEVFEFPPGTSQAAARESVAQVLLERGRARLERPIATRRLSSHRGERSPPASVDAD